MLTIPVSDVGATPVQVTATPTKLASGLLVVAAPTNTQTGFVGNGNTVTPGTNLLSGIPVFPGAFTFVPQEALYTAGTGRADAANAYVVCSSGSNTFYCVPDGDPRMAPAVLFGVSGTVASGDSLGGNVKPVIMGGLYAGDTAKAITAGPNGELTISGVVSGPTGSGQTLGYVAPVMVGGVDPMEDIACTLTVTRAGQALVRPFADRFGLGQYNPPVGGISNTTTPVILFVAPGNNLYTFLTALQIAWSSLGTGTELVIEDGTGVVLWRTLLPTAAGSMNVVFPLPIATSLTDTAVRAATVTAVTGNVYVNAQSFVGIS